MFYDSLLLEDLMAGYRTLKVEGREMLSTSIDSTSIQKGAIITNQTINARTITVTYQLKSATSKELQSDFKKLMSYLYRDEDVAIYFEDDPDTLFYGRYESGESVDGSSNSIVSSFNIFCADPFKYGKQVVTTGVIDTLLRQAVTPLKIEAIATKTGGLSVVKGKQTISMTKANLKVGDKVVIDFSKGKVFINNSNSTRLLDLDSDFSNFTVTSNDVVSCATASLKIYYRSVDL